MPFQVIAPGLLWELEHFVLALSSLFTSSLSLSVSVSLSHSHTLPLTHAHDLLSPRISLRFPLTSKALDYFIWEGTGKKRGSNRGLPGGVGADYVRAFRAFWGQRVKLEHTGWTGHNCPTDLPGQTHAALGREAPMTAWEPQLAGYLNSPVGEFRTLENPLKTLPRSSAEM